MKKIFDNTQWELEVDHILFFVIMLFFKKVSLMNKYRYRSWFIC